MMKKIKFAMCDNRLIHGQVIRRWLQYLKIDRIIVIDDEVAVDIIEKKLTILAAPENLALDIVSCLEFLELDEEKEIKALVLVRTLETVSKLLDQGVTLTTLSISRIPTDVGRKKFEKALYLNRKEVMLLRQLIRKRINVYAQTVPEDEKIIIKQRIDSYEKEFQD